MALKRFFDNIEIPRAQVTKEGYLAATARVTRTGVFDYHENGQLIRVLRHPDDVFDKDSLETLKQIPVTIDHPDPEVSSNRTVDASNSSLLAVGATGETVKRDGDFVVANLKVFDSKAVKTIKDDNIQEISLGYETMVTDESGEYKGQQYDMRQTEIRYNHLSFVGRGRAGPDVRVNLDQKTESKTMSNLVTIKLDGIDYQASAEVEKAMQKLQNKVDGLEATVAEKQKIVDSVQGERDQFKKELDEKSSTDNTAMIHDAAVQRIALLDTAKQFNVDSADKLSNADLMKSIVKSQCDGINIDEKSDDYVLARYEAILDSMKKEHDNQSTSRLASLADSASKVESKKNIVQDSYSRMIERTTNAYKRQTQ
jgi:hypothetical protein